MKRIQSVLWIYLAVLAVIWWSTDQTDFAAVQGVFAWRNVLNQLTGVLALGSMTLALLLALRLPQLERWLDGLDKGYRLHKWLGIASLVLAVSHWLIAKGPKWLVSLGWLERGARKPRPVWPEGSWQQLFSSQRGWAEAVGEWAFYLAVLLMVLALVKHFPYRRFFQTHRILALSYLALVYHAVILVKFDYWAGLLGVFLVPLLVLGALAAVRCVLRKPLGGTRAEGRIAAVQALGPEVLAVDVEGVGTWPGHAAGQFAFVTFHAAEGAHPFTIASAWQGDGRLRFLIKSLGDYTAALPERLKVGEPVQLQGPYGQFDFAGSGSRQIWIAGGIGVTPFMARLQALSRMPAGQPVDFFQSARQPDQAWLDGLGALAAAAQARLHLFCDGTGGRLDVAKLVQAVPEWREADVWFCGPARFGQVMRDGLVALGLPPARFHQELFDMR